MKAALMTAVRLGLLAMCLAGLLLLSACGGSATRFTSGPVVTVVEDDADISEPKDRQYRPISHWLDNFFPRQIRLDLDPVPASPAADVNRLGEVPNSSWYENRTASLDAEDVALGPGGDDPGPEAFTPWTITSWKVGGMNPGFIFKDSRGVGYICKFDKLGTPVVSTAAGAVAARLFWACGYHVPDDRVVFFQRSDLVLSEKLQAAAAAGEKDAITNESIDLILEAFVARRTNGDYRALVSRFLPGQPVGGFSYRGKRKDDPNDLIPHQNRRSLRGLRVFAAWLNHVDLKEDNTLDMYTELKGRHFLQHYFVDFDGCLGGYWAARHEKRIGYAYDLDLGEITSGLVTFGAITRPYENFGVVPYPEIGLFEGDVYEPGRWRANYFNDQVLSCRPADAYWAATVLARIDREQIAAAVTAARFEDTVSDSALESILYERWQKTVVWGLSRVTPVTNLADIAGHDLGLTIRAKDSLLHSGLPSDYRFRCVALDIRGDKIWESDAEQPTPLVTLPASVLSDQDYFIMRWTAVDPEGKQLPPSEGHYGRQGAGWQLRGILRDGE